MSESITIELPEKLDILLKQVVEASGETGESVLLDWVITSLNGMRAKPIDVQLEEFATFSTIHLWTIVQEVLDYPKKLNNRYPELIQKSKNGTISEVEQSESEDLGILYNKYVLLRTEALVELQERGYDIKGYIKRKHNERISESE